MNVLVTATLDPAGHALLAAAGLEVTCHPGATPMTPEALLAAVQGCDALISIARIYTRALTDTELTDNFNLQKARFGY